MTSRDFLTTIYYLIMGLIVVFYILYFPIFLFTIIKFIYRILLYPIYRNNTEYNIYGKLQDIVNPTEVRW